MASRRPGSPSQRPSRGRKARARARAAARVADQAVIRAPRRAVARWCRRCRLSLTALLRSEVRDHRRANSQWWCKRARCCRARRVCPRWWCHRARHRFHGRALSLCSSMLPLRPLRRGPRQRPPQQHHRQDLQRRQRQRGGAWWARPPCCKIWRTVCNARLQRRLLPVVVCHARLQRRLLPVGVSAPATVFESFYRSKARWQ